jgi:hypothetical protein
MEVLIRRYIREKINVAWISKQGEKGVAHDQDREDWRQNSH